MTRSPSVKVSEMYPFRTRFMIFAVAITNKPLQIA